jgi:hypothetical protein
MYKKPTLSVVHYEMILASEAVLVCLCCWLMRAISPLYHGLRKAPEVLPAGIVQDLLSTAASTTNRNHNQLTPSELRTHDFTVRHVCHGSAVL